MTGAVVPEQPHRHALSRNAFVLEADATQRPVDRRLPHSTRPQLGRNHSPAVAVAQPPPCQRLGEGTVIEVAEPAHLRCRRTGGPGRKAASGEAAAQREVRLGRPAEDAQGGRSGSLDVVRVARSHLPLLLVTAPVSVRPGPQVQQAP